MKRLGQHELGRLLIEIGQQMLRGYDTRAKVNGSVVVLDSESTDALQIEALVALRGYGDTDLDNCNRIAECMQRYGAWDVRENEPFVSVRHKWSDGSLSSSGDGQ